MVNLVARESLSGALLQISEILMTPPAKRQAVCGDLRPTPPAKRQAVCGDLRLTPPPIVRPSVATLAIMAIFASPRPPIVGPSVTTLAIFASPRRPERRSTHGPPILSAFGRGTPPNSLGNLGELLGQSSRSCPLLTAPDRVWPE